MVSTGRITRNAMDIEGDIFFADGHRKPNDPAARHDKATTAFMADLLPSTGYIPLATSWGTTRPLLALEESCSGHGSR